MLSGFELYPRWVPLVKSVACENIHFSSFLRRWGRFEERRMFSQAIKSETRNRSRPTISLGGFFFFFFSPYSWSNYTASLVFFYYFHHGKYALFNKREVKMAELQRIRNEHGRSGLHLYDTLSS